MHTARSARRVWSAPLSAVEYTATASIPSSCSARTTRTATSPRLATRTRLKRIEGPAVQGLQVEEKLAELDRLGVLDVDRADDALDVGLHLVHELHRLEDAERLARRDRVALLDERRRPRLRGAVEGAHHRRLHPHDPAGRRLDRHRPGPPRPRGGAPPPPR